MDEENVALRLVHSSTTEFQATIEVEKKTMGEAIIVVYEEMCKLHDKIAPIVAIKGHTKERIAMLKEVMTALVRIHEWFIKYPGALEVVPKKDWITMKNIKVQLCIKVQSKYKPTKDVQRLLASYKHLFSSLELVIQLHGVPPIGEFGQVKKQE